MENPIVYSPVDAGKIISDTAANLMKSAATSGWAKVKKYFKKHLKDTPYSEEANLLKFIFHNCDVKFYSDDPSWYFQGGFEDGAKAGISIYKFPGEPGDGTWHNRHVQSGGLYNSNIHLTKHMAQIVEQIDAFIPIICKSMVEQ